MKYLIVRSSIENSWKDNVRRKRPCKEAYKATYTKDNKEVEAWFVDIDTLEQLMAFHKKYGSIIIETPWYTENMPCIEIYDARRED